MPILFSIPAISGSYPDIAINLEKKLFQDNLFLFIGIFYLSGEPISPHRHRCSPFAVGNYSFIGRYLAATAISTRE